MEELLTKNFGKFDKNIGIGAQYLSFQFGKGVGKEQTLFEIEKLTAV